MANYTLSARLTADAKQFIAGFKQAQNEVNSLQKFSQKVGQKFTDFGNRVGKIGDSLTNKITKPALAAGAAVGGIVIAKGFQRLAGIDTARAKLVGLGHDAKSVDLIMESALTSVKGTAYGLDEAATTAANAVAAGIQPGKELTRYLTLAGDAAAIAGVDMAEMGSILNKVQTSNKAYNGELQQLADRGLPIYQWLAKEAGVADDAVFDLASNGEISSKMLLNAIEKNIGGAARKMGEESFTAGIANIWAAVGRLGASFLDAGGKGGGFFSVMKDNIPRIIDYLDGMGEMAEKAGEKFGLMFMSAIDKVKQIKQWYDDLSPPLQNIINKTLLWGSVGAVALGPFLKVVGVVSRVIGFIIPIAGKVIGVVRSLTAAFGAGGLQGVIANVAARFPMLASAIGLLSGPIGWIVLGVAALVTSLVIAYNKSETFREKVIYAFETVRDYVMIAIEAIRDFLMNVWGGIVVWWQENNEMILQATQNVWNVISSVIEIAMTVILGIFNFVWPVIQFLINDTWNAIKNTIQGAIDIILGVISFFAALFTGDWSALWDATKQILSGAVQALWGLINLWFVGKILKLGKTFMNLFKGVFQTGWNFIRNIFTSSVGAVRNVVTSGFNTIRNFISTIMSTIRNVFSNAWNSIRSTTGSVFNRIKDAIVKPIQSARDLVKQAIDRIKGFFSGLSSKLKITIPKPKLPRFSLSGSFSLAPPRVPKLSVSWHAKGGLMTKPTIFGMAGNTMLGGGEAGPEAILPLNSKVLGDIGKGIVNSIPTFNRTESAKSQNKTERGDIVFVVDGYELARIQEPYLNDMFGKEIDLTSYMRGER